MMSYDVDYLIVGGGLSGLTLALQMAKDGLLDNKQLCILEQRENYQRDRSWSGWKVKPHLFEQCVTHKWQSWSVSYKNDSVTQSSATYPYQYIPANTLYDFALEHIARHPNIELRLGVVVDSIQEHSVQTQNQTITCDWLFDARAVEPQTLSLTGNTPYLLQCFHGWHIRTEKAIFDPEQVTLMDFPENQQHGIQFFYVLPFSETEALVEPTYFLHHTNLPNEADFKHLLAEYMAKQYNCDEWDIVSQEHGILPMMRLHQQSSFTKVINIGSRAGLLRPATGYAFSGVMRYCEQISNTLLNHGQLKQSHAYHPFTLWMDEIFLRVCQSKPEHAANIFLALFKNTEAKHIAHFMHDEATLHDILRVILSVPKVPFIRSALQQSFSWSD